MIDAHKTKIFISTPEYLAPENKEYKYTYIYRFYDQDIVRILRNSLLSDISITFIRKNNSNFKQCLFTFGFKGPQIIETWIS